MSKPLRHITADELLLGGPPPLDPEFDTGYVRAFQYAGDLFLGTASSVDDGLESAREKCRGGNPFPLVARQWPSLVVPEDHDIADIFRKDGRPERFIGLPDDMQAVLVDDNNPLLRLSYWQKIILAGFFCELIGEIFVKGCTGAGKGAVVGMGVNLWYDVYKQSRTMCTSESFDHAKRNIFGEIGEWRQRMRSPGPGSLLGHEIHENKRHYVTVLNPRLDSGEAFSGIHGPGTCAVFDEASRAPDIFFSNVEKNARKIVALANPRVLFGRFRNAFKPLADENQTAVCPGTIGQRLCVTVSGQDCLNVSEKRLKRAMAPAGGISVNGTFYNAQQRIPPADYEHVKPLIPNQIDLFQYLSIRSNPDPRHVDVFAHGKFPVEDEEVQVILASWLDRHVQAWHPDVPVVCFGLDVARSLAGDSTVLAAGSHEGLRAVHPWQFNDVTYHAKETVRIARDEYGIDLMRGRNPVCVDYVGLGSGLGDLLRDWGVWVIEFVGSATSSVNPRLYANLRTEAYATLGRRLNPHEQWSDQPWALPDNEDLKRELVAHEKKYGQDAIRFRIESKDVVKQKLQGHSPDLSDAATYLWHAVREYYALNEYFAAYHGSLTVYPMVETKDGESEETDLMAHLAKRYGTRDDWHAMGVEDDKAAKSRTPLDRALDAAFEDDDDEDDW